MIEFEWDDKAALNFLKHGVLFQTAAKVFNDENRIEIYDVEHSVLGEDRYITIGLADEILFVVYSDRGKRIRLISARLATAREREIYYDNI